MSTEATLSTITAARRDSSSTAWFWWKETRQLAPLVVLLIIVAMVILLITLITDFAISSFKFQLPGEVTMLVFPGLFATGAGALMVGQERSQRTMDWLALLPISARRLVTTKVFVALAGLAVMWVFAIVAIGFFHMNRTGSSHWYIGEQSSYSGNPFSYPVWIAHSIFILLAGFYVAWRIENQFYSLVALIPLAFLPMMLTKLAADVIDRPMMTGDLDWINFGFTLLGIVVIAPLAYRAAIRTLGPDAAPAVKPLLGVSPHSPAQETHDAIAPRFGTQFAPIAWQAIHSARGTLAILVGILLASLLIAIQIAAFDGGLDWLIPHVLIAFFLGVSWLGVSVFKHDGSSERVRFLADRGVSPSKTYIALHAIPTAILCTALVLYGIWNLSISHRSSDSSFPSNLPTLLTLLLLTVLIYAISQWVSQFVRTLILSVILAPLLSIIVVSWLTFAFLSMGVPLYALVICGLAPLLATFVMMRPYMDTRDRPATFFASGLVLAVVVLLPIGFAAAHVLSVPAMPSKLRAELMSEARSLRMQSPPGVPLLIRGHSGDLRDWSDPLGDRIKEMEAYISSYSMDPEQIVKPLQSSRLGGKAATNVDLWSYGKWHGGFLRRSIAWRQAQDDQTWAKLTPWLKASATLLPALRRSTMVTDQEIADRLEVMMIDTLTDPSIAQRSDDEAVQAARDSLGTPTSRAAARRRAALVTWHHSQDENQRVGFQYQYYLDDDPQGLLPWISPRRQQSQVLASLAGIEAARKRSDEKGWRIELHNIFQNGGVFESSRYGDRMRQMPAMETMSFSQPNVLGHLWGRDWEYAETKPGDPEPGNPGPGDPEPGNQSP